MNTYSNDISRLSTEPYNDVSGLWSWDIIFSASMKKYKCICNE